jgi:hypothetical protein
VSAQRRASTYLLRQMIRADVEGSLAGFFVAGAGAGVGVGVGDAGLVVSAGTSPCALFFLRAMLRARAASCRGDRVCVEARPQLSKMVDAAQLRTMICDSYSINFGRCPRLARRELGAAHSS